jgi:acetyltransferase-like isoleucine patch superfamily enzyme
MNIGKYTYGKPIIHFENKYANISIGKFCSIGQNLNIYLGGEHYTKYVSTYPFGYMYNNIFRLDKQYDEKFTKGNVTIGNDVWIADNVTIMSGITIGDGSIIANNSHVVKNVEPYSIVGGNPAKFIKYRFTQEQISKLLQIKWWDWADQKINSHVTLLHETNIDNFIQNAL